MSQYTHLEQIILALRRRQYDEADRVLSQARQDPSFDINKLGVTGQSIVRMFSSSDRVDELAWLRRAGADVNIKDNNGETPLMSAVMSSSAPAVEALLQAGADPSITNTRGVAPLMQAVLNHKENGITKILLEGGAHPDPVSETGSTPLLAAASRGRAGLVDMLLEAGADPEAADFQGIGLLTSAVLARSEEDGAEAVLNVIKERAIPLDPNAPAKSGTTPMAAAIGNVGALSILMEIGGNVSVAQSNRFNDGMTLIQSTLANVKDDLPAKDEEDPGNLNPFIGMGIGGGGGPDEDPALILSRQMLERGASPSVRDDHGRNAGHYAMSNSEALGDLVANGLDPARPMNSDSVLPWDVLVPLGEIGKLDEDKAKAWIDRLRAHKFPFERPQWDESVDGPKPPPPLMSPGEKLKTIPPVLHRFVAAQMYDLAWHCVSKGADPDVRNENGEGIAHLLVKSANGMTNVEKKAVSLISRARNVDQDKTQQQLDEIMSGAKKRLDEIRRAANRSGVNWDAVDTNGNTPLHTAAATGNMEWVRWLSMTAGVGVEIRNDEGLTAAGVALKSGHAELAYALVKVAQDRRKDLRTDLLVDTVLASSDDSRFRSGWLAALEALKEPLGWNKEDVAPSSRDPDKRHPVFLAAATDMDDVMRLLLRYGGDVNAIDDSGNTALMAAMYNQNGEIIRQLRSMGCDTEAKNNSGQTALDVAMWVKTRYLYKMLDNDEGLDEVRQDVLGIDKKLTQEQKEQIVEDKVWFQEHLDKIVDYFYQKATDKDLSNHSWERPMSVRAREEAEKRQAEKLAEIAARKNQDSSVQPDTLTPSDMEKKSPTPRRTIP